MAYNNNHLDLRGIVFARLIFSYYIAFPYTLLKLIDEHTLCNLNACFKRKDFNFCSPIINIYTFLTG